MASCNQPRPCGESAGPLVTFDVDLLSPDIIPRFIFSRYPIQCQSSQKCARS